MTKYIHPEETLNIYYRVSEDTKDIEHINLSGDEDDISKLDNLQKVKKIQWSPDKEHEDETFNFDIDGISKTQKIKVVDIPESESDKKLNHRWPLNKLNNSIEDSIGDSNGSNNDIEKVKGNYAGGIAGKNKKDGYINVGEISSAISDWSNGGSFAFTIKTNDEGSEEIREDAHNIFGWADTSGTDNVFNWYIDNEGRVMFEVRVGTSNYRIGPDISINDGSKYRIVNIHNGNNAHDSHTWFVNQQEVSTYVDNSILSSQAPNTNNNWWMFNAENANNNAETILDDVCWFSSELTEKEVKSYNFI